MVGHTHEDIDQRFSCVSRTLKQASAKTLPELLQLVEQSMPSQSVRASRQGRVFNIRDWIEPFLNVYQWDALYDKEMLIIEEVVFFHCVLRKPTTLLCVKSRLLSI